MTISYCSYCGDPLAKSTEHGTEHRKCAACGQRFYENPLPCVGALLFNTQNELLLVLRKYPPHPKTWDVPGGFMDLEENAEQALSREIHEELGIRVDNWTYCGSFFDRYEFGKANYHTLNLNFLAHIGDQRPVASDDISTAQWFARGNVPYETISFPSLAKFLKEYLGRRD